MRASPGAQDVTDARGLLSTKAKPLVIADLFVRISCSSAFREACAAVRQAAVSVRRCTRLRKPNLKIRSWRLSACFLVRMPNRHACMKRTLRSMACRLEHHCCPAHEHPARSQPAHVEHMMMQWQVLLHGCGEASCGSSTSGLLPMLERDATASML